MLIRLPRSKPSELDPLIEGVRHRDPQAWAEIYERFGGQIYAFFLHQVRAVHLAEDLTAGVFMEALQAPEKFRGSLSDLRAWLFRIGRNNLIDHFRRRPHNLVSIEDVDPAELDPLGEIADPEELALASIDRQRVLRAIEGLSPDQKDVLLLRLTGDLTSAQIAELLGKTTGAVKALQHRAVSALARVLGGEPPPPVSNHDL